MLFLRTIRYFCGKNRLEPMKALQNMAVLAFFSLLITSCNHSEILYQKKLEVATSPTSELQFDRYEDVLFHLDTANFQEALKEVQEDYLPFLGGDLNNPEAIRYLLDFATDPFSNLLYSKVKEHYPDLKVVSEIVGVVYGHFNFYYPEISLPNKIYTCVSGINPEIPPVMITDDGLVISLDWYLDGDEVYEMVGMPKYRSDRTTMMTIAKDLGQLLHATYVEADPKQTDLLSEMVLMGKRDLFIEALYPAITDEVLLGYTPEQVGWVKDNEATLWADVVGKQLLYSSEFEVFRLFFSDGPFTNEYSHEAPARLGEYLGLQIVRSYFGSNEVTLPDLMNDKDVQGIFLDSGYKPKK